MAVSREMSVFTAGGAAEAALLGVSREFSVPVGVPDVIPPFHAIGREISALVPRYTFEDVALALRISAGLSVISPEDSVRLDVAQGLPIGGPIDVTDAARIMWLQANQ